MQLVIPSSQDRLEKQAEGVLNLCHAKFCKFLWFHPSADHIQKEQIITEELVFLKKGLELQSIHPGKNVKAELHTVKIGIVCSPWSLVIVKYLIPIILY